LIAHARVQILAIAALVALATPVRADSSTARHLLAGVHAFQAGHYEEALVELRVVQRAADAPADLAFYLGPTLYKLGRFREAIAVFVTSRAPADALTDLYLGQAYYQLRLFRKARGVFARLRGLGPVLDETAARYVAAVDLAYQVAPTAATIDSYIAQARELAASEPVVAGELYDEARQVEGLAAAPHRHAEIMAGLGAAWNATGRAAVVAELLAAEDALSDEGRWQLARAYAAIGDTVRARPLLDALVGAKGAHGTEAAALLLKLSP
jgi:tetratricopeptide (TPR) repeat protein